MIEKQGEENEFDLSKLSRDEIGWMLLLLLFATSDHKIIEEKEKEENEDEQKSTGTIR